MILKWEDVVIWLKRKIEDTEMKWMRFDEITLDSEIEIVNSSPR